MFTWRREGSGGSHRRWGLFSVATRQRKRSAGSALALGPQLWFGSRLIVKIHGGYVLEHGTFVALPTIMWWGAVGSVLGGQVQSEFP